MSNNKQSSVDILCKKLAMKLGGLAITFYIDHAEEIAEAKAMHKDEIIKSYATAVMKENNSDYIGMNEEISGEQYYNETFNNEN
jgi:hypothetical protein